MELEKKSNLRSLIPAVLVGLLALAANEYTKMDPAVLRDSVEAMEDQIAELMKNNGKPKPKKTDLGTLQKLNDKTLKIYEKWRETRQSLNPKKIRTIIEKADELSANVQDDTETTAIEKSRARKLRASAYFMAAEWAPTEYSREFLALAEDVISSEPPSIADQVAVLRFFHLTEFGEPNDQVLLADLRAFVARHSRESSIDLYSMVADELWRRGYRQLSLDVLNDGIRVLSGSPGISRLVNQLIDQKQQ